MTDELRDLFAELVVILENEGEKNWIRGIRAINNTLSEDNMNSEDAKIQEARQIYQSMYRGAGSFSDYYIQRDDSTERIMINERFDRIRDRIWELLF